MLEVVEDVHLAVNGLCGDDLRVLRHIPSLVNLALVINLHID